MSVMQQCNVGQPMITLLQLDAARETSAAAEQQTRELETGPRQEGQPS